MKRLHKAEKALSSIFGSHIEPGDFDALGDKKDIDKNVQKILMLIRAEENGHSSKGSELFDLVNDFHKHYETLYGRYDHLIGKVKKNIQHSKSQHGKLSFVLSSDSEESDTDERSNSSHISRPELEFCVEDYRTLQEQLESSKIRNNELEDEVSLLVRKLEGCEILADKLADKETLIEQLEHDLQAVRREYSVLEAKNGSLLEEIEESLKAFADMNEKMSAIQEEREYLLSEKSVLSNRVSEGDEYLRGCRTEIERLEEVVSVLQPQNETLLSENSALLSRVHEGDESLRGCKMEIERMEDVISSLRPENEALLLEKSALLNKVLEGDESLRDCKVEFEQMREAILSLQNENETLKEERENALHQVSDLDQRFGAASEMNTKLVEIGDALRQQLNGTFDEHNSLASDYTNAIEKLSHSEGKIEMLSYQLEKSTNESSKFLNDYEELERELESVKQELSELNNILEATRDEHSSLAAEKATLINKMQEVETIVADLREERERLGGDNLELQAKLGDKHCELEAAEVRLSDLNDAIGSAAEESRVLKGELSDLMAKLEQAETSTRELENELGKMRDENSVLMQGKIEVGEVVDGLKAEKENIEAHNFELRSKVSDLCLQLEGMGADLSSLQAVLETTQNEASNRVQTMLAHEDNLQKELDEHKSQKGDLEDQIIAMTRSSAELEISLRTLEDELNGKISDLNEANGSAAEESRMLKGELSVLMAKLEQAEMSTRELENELGKMRGENSVLMQGKIEVGEVVEGLKAEKENIEAHNSELRSKVSDMYFQLEGMGADLSSLQAVLETTQNEASNRVQTMLAREDNLQKELDEHKSQKAELEEHIGAMTRSSAELEISLRTLEDELNGKISRLESLLQDKIGMYDELVEGHKHLEGRYQESRAELAAAEEKIGDIQVQGETHQLEQKKEMRRMDDSFKEISEKLKISEAERVDVDRETAKLSNRVQTLEVQLRLSNQKLKITETECKEKVDGYIQMVSSLQEGRRIIEERMLASSKKAVILENDLKRTKEAVRVGVAVLVDALEKVEEAVGQNFGLALKRVAGCGEELHAVRKSLADLILEKNEMEMVLNEKEETISMLRVEVGHGGERFSEKEAEAGKLAARVAESEKKASELERRLREKEDEVVVTSEAKREAIRQLCVLAEYHRENCNRLLKYISANLKKPAA